MKTPPRVRAVAGVATAITVLTPVKPGRAPLIRLVLWIAQHVRPLNRKLVEPCFSAYPDVTTKRVIQALELRQHVVALHREAALLSPDEFARLFPRFLTDVQHLI